MQKRKTISTIIELGGRKKKERNYASSSYEWPRFKTIFVSWPRGWDNNAIFPTWCENKKRKKIPPRMESVRTSRKGPSCTVHIVPPPSTSFILLFLIGRWTKPTDPPTFPPPSRTRRRDRDREISTVGEVIARRHTIKVRRQGGRGKNTRKRFVEPGAQCVFLLTVICIGNNGGRLHRGRYRKAISETSNGMESSRGRERRGGGRRNFW